MVSSLYMPSANLRSTGRSIHRSNYMKKKNAIRLELCQLISDGLLDKDLVLLELISRTPPGKIRELIEILRPSEVVE